QPWQSVPPLIIIAGAFSVAGGIVMGVQYLANGEPRKVGRDKFDWYLQQRDKELKAEAKKK
ncbi:unnamed protein product, partial [Phaeothamnion confervicola]